MTGAAQPELDRLTGFLTRKEFETLLSGLMSGEAATLSIALLDIDHFKAVNDTFGHDIGDAVIIELAEHIRAAVPAEGVAARYGGEEFVLLLPGVEREQALLLVESLRSSMDADQRYSLGSRSAELRVTLSAGIAECPTDGRTATDILRKADQALYRAKETGRNKVYIAQEERMAAKTSHYTLTQLERLSSLAKEEGVGEAALLREALDDLLTKYKVTDVES